MASFCGSCITQDSGGPRFRLDCPALLQLCPESIAGQLRVELFTLSGAFAEARSQTSGFSTFGSAWELIVLAIVAGSFCWITHDNSVSPKS